MFTSTSKFIEYLAALWKVSFRNVAFIQKRQMYKCEKGTHNAKTLQYRHHCCNEAEDFPSRTALTMKEKTKYRSRVRFPAGAGNSSLHHRVQTGSGAHPPSYPMGTMGSFPGVKRPGREADHSPPSSAEGKECVELYLHSPILLHGVVLNLKYQLRITPWKSGPFKKLTVVHLINKFPAYDGTRKFIFVFARARHWSLY
jgi:hypothetical protein